MTAPQQSQEAPICSGKRSSRRKSYRPRSSRLQQRIEDMATDFDENKTTDSARPRLTKKAHRCGFLVEIPSPVDADRHAARSGRSARLLLAQLDGGHNHHARCPGSRSTGCSNNRISPSRQQARGNSRRQRFSDESGQNAGATIQHRRRGSRPISSPPAAPAHVPRWNR